MVFLWTITVALWSGMIPAQDFAKGVKPFLEKYCYECHGDELEKGHLNLEKIKDASHMFREQRLWRNVINQVFMGEMPPPKKKVRPTQAEMEELQRNLRGLLAEAQARTKVDPGAVTIRRLNRAEYNNTIRDLCLVEGDFSADFPADDTGYGFDNIGDVLSFSPVHLERFMAIGAMVASKAMPTTPNDLDSVSVDMISMLPRGKNIELLRFFNPEPSMSTTITVPRDGDYIVRVRLISKGAKEDPPAEIGVSVDGAQAHRQALKPNPAGKRAELVEAKVRLTAGEHNFTLTWLNPPADIPKSARTLGGYSLALLGPTDTRTELQRTLEKLVEGRKPEERPHLIVNWFVSRAFRRPATATELRRYEAVFAAAEKTGGKWEAGAQVMIAMVLASPKFVFRAEQDEQPTAVDAHPVGEFTLASRLSYFIWGSMPDQELLALAGQGKLAANLEAQALRLLRDPRSRYLVTGFGLQWLQLRRLSAVTPDARKFPEFNDALRAGMIRETELFLSEIVREDRPVTDMIDADYTYVNRPLARLYKLGEAGFPRGRDNGEFIRVKLPAGDRGGILTQASILTATSNPDRTSPVKRGKWILEQILGTPPPPAPASVASLESQHELKGTLRQRMEQHRANPTCASCHTRMDAIGFAFERFDAVGRARTSDEGAPIETAGKLPDGRVFAGAAELKAILKADQDKFVRNLASQLMIFGLGRGLEYYDEPAIDRVAAETAKGRNRLSALVLAVVRSDPFRLRRGTSQVEKVSDVSKPKK